MNNVHSRTNFPIDIRDLNAEAATLAVTIKKNFQELGV